MGGLVAGELRRSLLVRNHRPDVGMGGGYVIARKPSCVILRSRVVVIALRRQDAQRGAGGGIVEACGEGRRGAFRIRGHIDGGSGADIDPGLLVPGPFGRVNGSFLVQELGFGAFCGESGVESDFHGVTVLFFICGADFLAGKKSQGSHDDGQ